MPAAINEFLHGVDRDTDNLKIKNTFLRDALNVRIINVDGQGFVATNLKGNEKRFELSEGYIPIGHCVYGGIAYIASYNPDDRLAEIGSFPSPNAGGFTLEPNYKPLRNFTAGDHPRNYSFDDRDFRFSPSILKSSWSESSVIRMFGRVDYDNSTNIYFADGSNPNFVINSGFRQNGSIVQEPGGSGNTERRYGNQSFPYFVSMFHESAQKPKINDFDTGSEYGVLTGGSLRAGHWHLFVRYMNESFDTTSWSAESRALAVAFDDSESIVTSGGNLDQETNRRIRLQIENLDTNYKFIEIGYEYSADGNKEFGIIDKKIEIPVDGSPIDIDINGSETFITTDVSEIFKIKSRFDSSKDHLDLENRYWMSNLRDSSGYNDQRIRELREFALGITCQFAEQQVKFRESSNPNEDIGDPSKMIPVYGNHVNVYKFPGYFRGEAYPFGVVFVLKSGRETDAFPITGKDELVIGGTANGTNDKGIYRFPSMQFSPFMSHGVTDLFLDVMGVRFDPTNASSTQWILDNVAGYYYVRGERIANLQYQGYTLPCYTSDGDYKDPGYLRSFNNDITPWAGGEEKSVLEKRNKNYFPLQFLKGGYDGIPVGNFTAPSIGIPLLADVDSKGGLAVYNDVPGSDIPTSENLDRMLHAYTGRLDGNHKIGLVSPDFHFKQELNLKKGFISPYFEHVTIDPPVDAVGSRRNVDLFNAMLRWFFTPFQRTSIVGLPFNIGSIDGGESKKLYHVLPWESSNNGGFVSRFLEGSSDGAATLYYKEAFNKSGGKFYKVKNAPFALPSYIGIDMEDNDDLFEDLGISNTNSFLVNIYSKPVNLFTKEEFDNYYIPKNTKYFKISDFQDISSSSVTGVIFQGDCFLQRTFIKMLSDTRPSSEGVEITRTADENDPIAHLGLDQELKDSGGSTSDTFGIIGGVGLPKRTLNSFGYIKEMITENSVNTELRHDNFINKCYPQSYSNTIDDLEKFAISENDQEATEYNVGYSQILSSISHIGDNTDAPEVVDNYPTRIHYSNKHANGSFIDSYRIIDLADFRDYDFRMGEITSIQVLHGKLFSIQERGINAHYVNDRSLLSPESTTSGQLTIGTGEVLAEKHLNITDDYGSQHIESIVQSDNAIYGVDFNKRKVWRATGSEQPVELISDTKLFRKDIVSACEFLSEFSDATEFLLDAPNDSIGIVSGFDRKFNEINFTFVGFLKGSQQGYKTFAFSEAIDKYLGERSYTPHMYMTIEEDFFSTGGGPQLSLVSTRNEFYYHDSGNVDRCNFHNIQYEAHVVAVVNIESDVIKDWYNWEISAGPEVPIRVEYETEHQTGVQDPFLATEVYLKPEYRENKWFLPFRRADAIVNDPNGIYGNQTALRGDYVTIKLIYDNQVVKIKSFVTWFEKSYT